MQHSNNTPTDLHHTDLTPQQGSDRVRPIEYALVAVIAGAIGFMAVPALDMPEKDMVGMAQTAQLQAKISAYRDTLDVYRAEHVVYPGYSYGQKGAWEHGPVSGVDFRRQLLFSSTELGRTSPVDPGNFPLGPYFETGMLTNPINGLDTVWLLRDKQPFPAEPTGTTGWIYKPATGEIYANCEGESALTGAPYYSL
jgi:hypothetical protein